MEDYSAQHIEEIFNHHEEDEIVSDTDVDMYSVNLTVNRHLAETLLILVGTNIVLSSSTTRKYPSDNALDRETFAISFIPSVILVPHNEDANLKHRICRAFQNRGQTVLPSSPETNYLVAGTEKGVATKTFVDALVSTGLSYIRVIHFGSKIPLTSFPNIDRQLRMCDAARLELLPENQFDISMSIRTNHIYCVRLVGNDERFRQDIYTTLTTLDSRPHPRRSRGGTVNIKPTAGPIVQVKVYNLLFHLLRAVTQKKLDAPLSTRAATKRLLTIKRIHGKLAEHPELVGGIRVETRIHAPTLEDAVSIYNNYRPYNLVNYLNPTEVLVSCIAVDIYIRESRRLIALAREMLRTQGVITHHNAPRPITVEQKAIFGDLKMTLGYTHLGYKPPPPN